MEGDDTDLRIALLGNRGTGKSSAANTILDRDAFRVQFSARAVTQSCERRRREENGRTISVIDTPGLFDTSLTKEQLEAEMENLARMSDPGLHAFLLVIRLDVGLSDKEKNMLKWIQKYFGRDATRYTFILFTHADQLNGEPLDDFVMDSPNFQSLIRSCENRYYSFNNVDRENRDQVTELLERIEESTGHHSTLQGFTEAQMIRKMMKCALFAGLIVAAFLLGGFAVVVFYQWFFTCKSKTKNWFYGLFW